jgi:hypothetical protein
MQMKFNFLHFVSLEMELFRDMIGKRVLLRHGVEKSFPGHD